MQKRWARALVRQSRQLSKQMAYDQEIRLIIKSIYQGGDTKVALGDLRLLVEAHRAGNIEASKTLDYIRQSKSLQGAGSNTGAGLATSANLPYSGPLPPIIGGGGDGGGGGSGGGGGGGYAMRRHFGAIAGQVLGLPGLGMAAAVGGIAGVIGGVVIGLEKVVRLFKEWYAMSTQLRDIAMQYATIGDKVANASEHQRDLNRQQELFNQSLSHVRETVRSTTAQIAQMQQIQEKGAQYAIDQENAAGW